MLYRHLIFTLGILVLSSCATQMTVTHKYSNPNIPSENKESQWLIDRGECLQESNKVSLPIKTPCFGSGFSKGYCQGEQTKLLNEAKQVRQQTFNGCVAKKGYKIETIQIKER